jgi:hypothetical protein
MQIMNFLKNPIPLSLMAAMALLGGPSLALADEGNLVLHPKQIGGSVDFGQIVKGEQLGSAPSDKQPLTRTGVYLTSSGTYDRKLEFRMTVGGLFWYSLPESPTTERLVHFGPGVGQAQGIYSFGNPDAPSGQLQFGLFPIKYNSDASNLGEYLYRSGTYPGYLWTGGWSYLNSASYMAQGFRFSVPTFGGKVMHDFTLLMERDIAPNNDLSPGYLLTAKPTTFLELGGGVVWANALSANSSRLSRKVVQNAYSKSTGMPVMGINANCASADTAISNTCEDPDAARGAATYNAWAGCDLDNDEKPDAAGNCSDIGYYTFRGFKTMARASVDLGVLIDQAAIKPGQFKVYSEVALLGVEDQPFYYEHKSERMPIMAGIRIPTFGLLNQLAVETEYHKSRFRNTLGLSYDRMVPVPLKSLTDVPYNYMTGKTDDDWKWSVFASRTLTEGVTLHAQAASDYSRHFNIEAVPSDPVTAKPSQWYYVLRLDFGIF